MRATARPPSTPTRTRRPRTFPTPHFHRTPRAGTTRSGSSSSTGTTSVRGPIHTPLHSSSRDRPSVTRASSATGRRISWPAPKASRHPSSEAASELVARLDAKLPVHVAQVVLDRLRAQEDSRRRLARGLTVGDKSGALHWLAPQGF